MPWRAERSDDCPASKPWAVVKIGTGEVEGCHATREDAMKQVAALYASEGKAVLSSAARENIPDSGFACPEKRLYPHHKPDGSLDLVHLRAALSRIGDPNNDQCGKAHLLAHRKAAGIGEGKALLPVKAQLMDTDELTAWLEGRIPRRVLSIPFGGPIPSAKSSIGVDYEGEWFSERTDIYGPYSELRKTRERIVDWHHSLRPPSRLQGDPTGVMNGRVLGKSILDDEPESDGWWSDFWLKQGEKRLSKIAELVKRGAQLFGSSQPLPGVEREESGEITVWPHWLQTLSTSPVNTFSIVKPKALLEEYTEPLSAELRHVLASLGNLSVDLGPTFDVGEDPAKSGRVDIARFERALDNSLEAFKPQPH